MRFGQLRQQYESTAGIVRGLFITVTAAVAVVWTIPMVSSFRTTTMIGSSDPWNLARRSSRRRQRFHSKQLSLSNDEAPISSPPQQAAACLNVLPQTKQDQELEKWFQEQGILMGNRRGGFRGVQISTSDQSIGERGLFLTLPSSLWDDDDFASSSSIAAYQGDILAYVPGDLVLLPSNMQASFPCLFHDKNNDTDDESNKKDFSWQSILTTYVWKALYQDPRIDDEVSSTSSSSSAPDWRAWIASWAADRERESGKEDNSTMICGPDLPQPYEDYTASMIERMAELSHATPSQVQEMANTRYQTFQKDWENVRDFLNNENESSADETHQQTFAELYSLVLSRTANLGPEWGYQMGIIPLHDMCNHPPYGQEPNVELFCLGDIRSMIGNDHLQQLLRPLLVPTQNQSDDTTTTGTATDPAFMDRDFVLAARRPIRANEELWLNYKSNEGEMPAELQLWLLLQYGFPFRPS